jgi:hypothetical protein
MQAFDKAQEMGRVDAPLFHIGHQGFSGQLIAMVQVAGAMAQKLPDCKNDRVDNGHVFRRISLFIFEIILNLHHESLL